MFTSRTKRILLEALITKRRPLYVQYALTKRCNLACRMCGSNDTRKDEQELDLSQIEQLADTLDKLRVGIILLTGGEPFLRADLPEVIKIFAARGLTVRVQTNGIAATEEKIRAACVAGLREITISLDSLDPETQEYLTCKKDSWREIIAAISRFSQQLPVKGTLLGINVVVCRKNLHELPRLVRFITSIGFHASLIPIHLSTSDADDFIIRKHLPEIAFTSADHDDIDRIYAELIRMKRQGSNIYNSYRFLRQSPAFLKGQRILWNCESPHLYFAISPSGMFLPCVDLSTSYSMLAPDFYERYHSATFQQEIRQQVTACPGCFYACWPEMSFLCHDAGVLAERVMLGLRASVKKRVPVTVDDCLSLIQRLA